MSPWYRQSSAAFQDRMENSRLAEEVECRKMSQTKARRIYTNLTTADRTPLESRTNLWFLPTVRAPRTSRPSSVRVPVLSKQTISSFPPTLTLYRRFISKKGRRKSAFRNSTHFCGLMQKIDCFFRRERAKFVPMVRVAGRAGGTTIVIKSSARTMIRCQASCLYLVTTQMTASL
jgi:hypothetical protein